MSDVGSFMGDRLRALRADIPRGRASADSDVIIETTSAHSRKAKAMRDAIAVNTTYRAFRASPLHGLVGTRKGFIENSQALVRHLRSEMARIGATTRPYTIQGATFEAPTRRLDFLEIRVTFEKTVHNTTRQSEAQVILCSLTETQDEDEALTSKRAPYPAPHGDAVEVPVVFLPLVLVKGPQLIGASACDWIQKTFDCSMAPLWPAPHDLVHLVGEWAHRQSAADQPLELVFEPPPEVTGLRRIVYTIDATTVLDLRGEFSTAEDRNAALFDVLVKQFVEQFGIHLTGLTLARVSCPLAMLACDGKLKFHDAEALLSTVASLRRICLPQLFESKPVTAM